MITLSIDVGATKTHFGLLDGFKVTRDWSALTYAKRTKGEVIKNLLVNTRQFLGADLKKVEVINIAWAGEVVADKGIVRSASNFNNFKNVELGKIIKAELRRPVTLENDAKCFAIAESILGRGKNFSLVLGLTIGTGIGAGLVIDKKLFRGRDNLAGEAGHALFSLTWPKDLPTRKCGCPVGSHWEALASGPAWSLLEKNYRAGRADEIIANNLARGIASLITIYNPHIVVIGGGLANRSTLFNRLRKKVRDYLPYEVLKSTPLVKPLLGDKAILIGAKLAGRG